MDEEREMQAITRKGPLLHSVLIVPTPSADRQRKPRQACGWRTHPAGPWSGGPGFPSRLRPFAWGSAPRRRGLCVESLCHVSRLCPSSHPWPRLSRGLLSKAPSWEKGQGHRKQARADQAGDCGAAGTRCQV